MREEMCEHHAPRQDRRKRMGRALAANLVSVAYSIGAGIATGNPIYPSEALHSGSDAAIYGSRLYADSRHIDQSKRSFRNFLRASMLIPAGILLYSAWKAGVDLNTRDYLQQQSSAVDIMGAVVVMSTNGYAYRQMHGVEEHTHASHSTYAHTIADFGVSATYSGGLLIEAAGVQGASHVATVIGSAGAAGYLVYEAISLKDH